MGRLFADFDWIAHPLGPPQSWPAEVRSAVAVVLTSRFPIVLWLRADDLFLIYNDAYIQILGDKHPEALGQRGQYAWWDIWQPISPMLASVIVTGEATWSNDLMLPIVTAGRRQERLHLQSADRRRRQDLRDILPVFRDHRTGAERASAAPAQRGGLRRDGHQHH
jgi:hypothetical protein